MNANNSCFVHFYTPFFHTFPHNPTQLPQSPASFGREILPHDSSPPPGWSTSSPQSSGCLFQGIYFGNEGMLIFLHSTMYSANYQLLWGWVWPFCHLCIVVFVCSLSSSKLVAESTALRHHFISFFPAEQPVRTSTTTSHAIPTPPASASAALCWRASTSGHRTSYAERVADVVKIVEKLPPNLI